MAEQPKGSTQDFEKALAQKGSVSYVLKLYVTGTTSRSMAAISNIKKICESHLNNRYDLEIIDTYQKPHMVKDDQVLAMPTLIKKLPAPLKRIIGDLSDKEKVLIGLDLIEKP